MIAKQTITKTLLNSYRLQQSLVEHLKEHPEALQGKELNAETLSTRLLSVKKLSVNGEWEKSHEVRLEGDEIALYSFNLCEKMLIKPDEGRVEECLEKIAGMFSELSKTEKLIFYGLGA